jgi:hypothetical protein
MEKQEYPKDPRDPSRLSLSLLMNRARTDTKLAAAMIADLDKVINEYKLTVDPKDKVYQELSLRMYHFRNTQVTTFVESLNKEFAGELEQPPFDPLPGGPFGVLVDYLS